MKELSGVKYITGGKIVVLHFDMEREQTDSDIKEIYKKEKVKWMK